MATKHPGKKIHVTVNCEWVNKMLHIYAMVHYSGIKRNKLNIHPSNTGNPQKPYAEWMKAEIKDLLYL